MNQVQINPPIKNPTTAIREGNCRLDNPVIACPEVHPSAYLVPNPTRNPPTINKIKPFIVSKNSILKSCDGFKAPSNCTLSVARSAIVASESCKGKSPIKKVALIHPPKTAPARKSKLHFCDLQSKSKKLEYFPAPHAAQMILRLDDSPKVRPKSIIKIITKAIKNPDTYHGQG